MELVMLRCGPTLIVTFVSITLVSAVQGQDWPHWRGPNFDGKSAEKGFEPKWDQTPPRLWEQKIGSAFSGLTCVAGKVYTCGTADKQQVLFCLNADTGAILWQTPIEGEYKDSSGGDGTRATPTFDDGRIYILAAQGHLVCCDAATGQEIWSRQLDGMPRWGYAGSVVIEGDLALGTAGGNLGGLIAVNKKTGEPVWHTAEAPTGYSTPYPFTFDGTRYIAILLAKEALVVDAKTGAQAWQTPWVTDWDVNAATPIFHDGLLFLTSGYKTGAAVFKLTHAGDKLTGANLWGSEPNKVILGKFQTPVLVDGNLYVSDEKALKCVDFASGKERWSQRGIANGTVVWADGYLVVLTEEGELQIAKASPTEYRPLTKGVELLSGRCWTVPTLYQGRLYVRNLKVAACYDLARR
jgi:outer membrane protein assembly factor BamB